MQMAQYIFLASNRSEYFDMREGTANLFYMAPFSDFTNGKCRRTSIHQRFNIDYHQKQVFTPRGTGDGIEEIPSSQKGSAVSFLEVIHLDFQVVQSFNVVLSLPPQHNCRREKSTKLKLTIFAYWSEYRKVHGSSLQV